MIGKWVVICDDEYTRTEVICFGHIGLIRTTNVISSSVSMIEISTTSAKALCQKYSIETVDGNKELLDD